MHVTQSQLYADHFNMLRLLRCLEVEVAHCEEDHCWSERLSIILDIFDYVQTYPQAWHHPLEDAVFALLLIKQVPNSEQVWAVKAEHKKLEALTRQASQLFTSVANDSVVPVDELVGASREFVNRQLDHIDRENRLIYPLFDEYISFEEWEMITVKVAAMADPLFDHRIRAEYEELYHHIMLAEKSFTGGVVARALELA